MSKVGKIVLVITSIIGAVIIGGLLLVAAFWNGAFNFVLPNEIATYPSPDGEYSLVFEQMGDPEWPFGATDVRLTLKDPNDNILERVSTQIHDDGANTSEHNIVSVSWNEDAVVVVLRGSEMQEEEVTIPYNEK